MADPIEPAAPAPAGSQPQAETKIQKRYREAGYARNRAELAYNTAVKEHGENSDEAKAAKETLKQAQASVEAIQKELNPKKAQKNPAPAPAKTEPKKELKELLKAVESFSEKPKGEYIYRTYNSEMLIRHDVTKYLDPKKVEEFRKLLEKIKEQRLKDEIQPKTFQLFEALTES